MRNTKKLLNAGITIKEEVYYYVRVCSWFYGTRRDPRSEDICTMYTFLMYIQ